MRARVGVVRALIGVLWIGLLVVPVGVEGPTDARKVASVGEALIELANGNLGVGLLSGLVAGGELARQAVIRIVLAVLAAIAFWLAGLLRVTETPAPAANQWRRCPACGKRASWAFADCPSCGTTLREQG